MDALLLQVFLVGCIGILVTLGVVAFCVLMETWEGPK